jgi:hypothetical protein
MEVRNQIKAIVYLFTAYLGRNAVEVYKHIAMTYEFTQGH